MQYSRRIIDAMALMYALHGGQFRKGGRTPYLTHLMAVAAIVGRYGGDEDLFIAALLHDAVEDQGGLDTLAEIRDAFGASVADLVLGASDSHDRPKPPWRERKEAHIQHAAEADGRLKLLLAADKLDNARSIVADLAVLGDRVWDRFTGKKEGSLWYYRAMRAALSTGWDHPILYELDAALHALGVLSEER